MERHGDLESLKGHIVICHANEMVKRIVEELHGPAVADPLDIVLLEPDPAVWETHPDWRPDEMDSRARLFTLEGDPPRKEDLRRAGIERASCAVILADPRLGELADARSALVAMAIERENPRVHTIIELLSPVTRVHVRATQVNEVVCRGEVAERLIAQSCITPGIKNLFQKMLSTAEGECRVFLSPLGDGLAGSTYRTLARRAVVRSAPFMLCGFVRTEEGEPGKQVRRNVLSPPAGTLLGKDTPLVSGDELVLLARQRPDLARWLGEEEEPSC